MKNNPNNSLRFDIIQPGTFEMTREKGVTDNRPTCSLLRFHAHGDTFNLLIDIDHPIKDSRDIIGSLSLKGLKPEQIDAIILTHLHPDHFGHKDLFPNALFIFHTEERFAFYFKNDNTLKLETSVLWTDQNPLQPKQLKVTPDFQALKHRLYIRHCPGHTKGSLVIFACINGWVHAFVGGIFLNETYYRNWQPPGMSWDQTMIYPQMAFIKKHADIIIPGHGGPFMTEKGQKKSKVVEYESL